MSLSLGPETRGLDDWFAEDPAAMDWGPPITAGSDAGSTDVPVAFAEASLGGEPIIEQLAPQSRIGRLVEWFTGLGVVGKASLLADTVHDTTT